MVNRLAFHAHCPLAGATLYGAWSVEAVHAFRCKEIGVVRSSGVLMYYNYSKSRRDMKICPLFSKSPLLGVSVKFTVIICLSVFLLSF